MRSRSDLLRCPWRVGTQVGRTIYAMPPGSSYRDGEVLIGMMDTPELARAVVDAHVAWLRDLTQERPS